MGEPNSETRLNSAGSNRYREFAAGLMACAVALAAARYTLLPLSFEPSWLSSILPGLVGGMIVGGFHLFRQAQGPASVGRIAGFAAMGTLAAVGVVFAIRSAVAGGGGLGPSGAHLAQLEPIKVPGVQIALPDWAQREGRALGPMGVFTRNLPKSQGEVRFEYAAVGPLTREEMAQALTDMLGGLDPTHGLQSCGDNATPTRQGEAPTVCLHAARLPLTLVMSSFACPEGPTVNVAVILRSEPEPARSLHERILAETVCTGDAAGVEAMPWPQFDPPEGFVLTEDSVEGRGYANDTTGDAIILLPPSPQLDLPEGLARTEPVRQALIRLVAGDNHPLPSPPSRVVDGVQRHFWAFSANGLDEQGKVFGVMSAWPCASAGISQVSVYLTENEGQQDQGAAWLSQVRCPAGQ